MTHRVYCFLFAIILGLSVFFTPKAYAQGYVYCQLTSEATAPCSVNPMNSSGGSPINCDPGYKPPCPGDQDCCLYYYSTHNQSCPSKIACVNPNAPTNTVTPPPAPNVNDPCYKYTLTNPSLMYCGNGAPCQAGYYCQADQSEQIVITGCTGKCVRTPTPPSTGTSVITACGVVPTGTQRDNCNLCVDPKNNGAPNATPGVWTAIGCITTDPNNLLSTILRFALGIAGGIAFVLILFGGLQIMTSAGNPEQLNGGRELITSAIIGLIIVLFSVFLLQFIGINIIGIPGFINPSSIPNALSRP